jgi:superfamily II DNA or RNA helicase
MTEIIKITKKNDVFLRVDATPGVMQELQEFFTFEVPGAKFHPAYRNKMWNGKISLYSMFTKEIYVGLYDYILKFAELNEYEIDQTEYDQNKTNISKEEVRSFCEALQLASNQNLIEIREYQIDAIHAAITDKRKLLVSPTGSGKSLMIYSLIRWNLLTKKKQLIIVPTTSLVEQLYSDFEDYSSKNNWNVAANCHRIYGGKEKINDLNVVISTWQSLQKLPKSFFEKFDCVYGDEAHLFKAKSLTGIMTKCVNAGFKVGTTGTLDGTQTHKLVLEGLFGSVYRVTTTKKLMDSKQLAQLKIFCLIIEHSEESKKLCRKFDYQKEMDFIVTNDKRNKFIRNLSLDCKGNTLILFQYIEKQGKVLYNLLREKIVDERKVFFIHGATEATDREMVRSIVEKEQNAIIIASYGTFSAGVNIKNLHNIIFASPTKSRIRNLQSIGRGLRTSDQKTQCVLYDIGDDLSWKKRKNFTLTHIVERIKIYAEESFEYKIINIKW